MIVPAPPAPAIAPAAAWWTDTCRLYMQQHPKQQQRSQRCHQPLATRSMRVESCLHGRSKFFCACMGSNCWKLTHCATTVLFCVKAKLSFELKTFYVFIELTFVCCFRATWQLGVSLPMQKLIDTSDLSKSLRDVGLLNCAVALIEPHN